MSFKNDMKTTTCRYIDRLADIDARAEKFQKENGSKYTAVGMTEKMNEFEAERRGVIAEGKQAILDLAENYKNSLPALFTPKGTDIAEDAKLLESDLKLSQVDLERLWDKNDNQTMRRMIWEYSLRNNVNISRAYYTEDMKKEAADDLARYCVMALTDKWKSSFVQSEKHYGSVVPAAVSE